MNYINTIKGSKAMWKTRDISYKGAFLMVLYIQSATNICVYNSENIWTWKIIYFYRMWNTIWKNRKRNYKLHFGSDTLWLYNGRYTKNKQVYLWSFLPHKANGKTNKAIFPWESFHPYWRNQVCFIVLFLTVMFENNYNFGI